MDKKILRSIEALRKVGDELYKDHDLSLAHLNRLNMVLNHMETCLLESDKKYDAKHEKMRS